MSMGWCYICHKWVWPWRGLKTPPGVLSCHKTCEKESDRREKEYLDKYYETEDEEEEEISISRMK